MQINIVEIKQAITPETQIRTNHVHLILTRAIDWTFVETMEA
jgi:hypothetical protein